MRDKLTALVDQLHDAAQRRTTSGSASELANTLRILRADYPASAARNSSDSPIDGITAVFGLDDIDCALLTAAAAVDIDANMGIAYALLRGEMGVARCTVALALELAGVATAAPEAFARLGSQAPLRRHRLVDVVGTEPWGQRRLHVPEPVLAALVGGNPNDPLLAPLQSAALPLELPGYEQIAAAIEHGISLIWVRSMRGAAGASLAAGALAALRVATSTIDLRRRGANAALPDLLTAAVREAALRKRALLINNADALAEHADPALFDTLTRAPIPVIVVSGRPWNPNWLPHLPLLVEAERLTVEQRAQLWRSQVGDIADDEGQSRQTLFGLRLNPESIAEASRYARVLAAARQEQLSVDGVREAARRVSGSGSGLVQGFAVSGVDNDGPTFADLLVPSATAIALRQLVNWVRHRDEVVARGLLRYSGQGIAALFTGSPGTGKTLAANVIARELSMDLFQVELSAIVDKYIGETEKNLERVFQAAEALDVVLFFDEADALFGARSEVRDARDRYANQEVAYLLQRIEQFDGVTILATNLRGNFDRAFSRRMTFIVNFPDPDVRTRRRLWEHHLALLEQIDSADPIQLDFLAETAELTGGDIRNIVRAAAYAAVSAGEPLGMRHIAVATDGEYRKLGRVLPEHGFVARSESVPARVGT